MSRNKSLGTCSLLLLLGTLVLPAQGREGSATAKTWSCPIDWKAFTKAEPYECLWASSTLATSYENADAFCQAMDSNLVTILSEEKWKFVQRMIERSAKDSTWMALRKDSRNYGHVTWRTRRGEQHVVFRPRGFQTRNVYTRSMCVVMNSQGNWIQRSCDGNYRMFVCEKQVECYDGHFGTRCEKQCHCHGETCNASPLDVTCRFGCQPGWMGVACGIRREKASVAYHCIHSGDSERRVSIEIDTKGIPYRHIQAIDNEGTAHAWCNDTKVYMSQPDKFVNINIQVTDGAVVEMKEGRCAGQQVEGGVYEWRIALQEWEGIFMPDDQVALVRCNFSDAESLLRSGTTTATGKIASATTESKETKEEVVLEVVDAATQVKLSSTFVGAPVLLKVKFGLREDSLVRSLFPYDCEATTADGAQRLPLLDSNGCQVEGSPVEPFARTSDQRSLATPWFPYFTFHGQSHVIFQCAFVFCYDDSCGLGCGNRSDWETAGRFVRTSNGDF